MKTIVFTFMLMLTWVLPAAAQELPQRQGDINDFAGVISPADFEVLRGELAAFEAKTSHEIVVATVPSLSGTSIETYSLKLANRWGIGMRSGKGVLLLVAPKERKTRIEVSRGAQSLLSDSRATSIVQNDMIPHFRSGNFSAGILAGTRGIASTLDVPPPRMQVGPNASTYLVPVATQASSFPWTPVLLVLGTIGLIAIVWYFIKKREEDLERERERELDSDGAFNVNVNMGSQPAPASDYASRRTYAAQATPPTTSTVHVFHSAPAVVPYPVIIDSGPTYIRERQVVREVVREPEYTSNSYDTGSTSSSSDSSYDGGGSSGSFDSGGSDSGGGGGFDGGGSSGDF